MIQEADDQENQASIIYQGKSGRLVTRFVADSDPENMVVIWSPTNGNQDLSANQTTFENLCLKYLDSNISSSSTAAPKLKRRKVNPYGEIVTSDEHFQKAQEASNLKKTAKRTKKNPAVLEAELFHDEEENCDTETSDTDFSTDAGSEVQESQMSW